MRLEVDVLRDGRKATVTWDGSEIGGDPEFADLLNAVAIAKRMAGGVDLDPYEVLALIEQYFEFVSAPRGAISFQDTG